MAKTGKKRENALTTRWEPDEWDRLERAADLLTEQLGFKVHPSRIIKSGALRRADEILAAA